MDYIVRHALVIMIVSGVIVVLIDFFCDVRPVFLDHELFMQKEKMLEEKLQQRMISMTSTPQLKKEDINQALTTLVLSIEKTGLQVRVIETKQLLHDKVSVHLVLIGQLSQWFYFLEKIQKLKFLILFNYFTISMLSDGDVQFDAKLDVNTSYVKRSEFIKYNSQKFNSLLMNRNFALQNELDDRKNEKQINRLSIKQLQFLGRVTSHAKIWAILRLPNNQIIRVTLGDRVGLERKRISQVNTTNINYANE